MGLTAPSTHLRLRKHMVVTVGEFKRPVRLNLPTCWLKIERALQCLVAVDGDAIVGMAVTIDRDRITELLMLYVAAAHRRQGVATALVQRVIAGG
jgi:GNAT superfamily N-acetyltransferase